MRLRARQHRFLLLVVGGWTAARVVMLWPSQEAMRGIMATPGMELAWPRVSDGPVEPIVGRVRRPLIRGVVAARAPAPLRSPAPLRGWQDRDRADHFLLAVAKVPGGARALVRYAPSTRDADRAPSPPPMLLPGRGGGADPRLRGEAYLFARSGSGPASLAAGGQLGASQVAARLTYRLNRDGAERLALAARIYAPLRGRGAEAAAGIDWHPLPGRSLRLSVERRQRLDRGGRAAWSAYAAGGFYREPARDVILDGYAQAGVVGAARRDLFVDGALRAGVRTGAGWAPVLGAGVWGAAQPDAARLDIGPRGAVTLPIVDRALVVALEGRFRVAGRAAPGSGIALTVAAAF